MTTRLRSLVALVALVALVVAIPLASVAAPKQQAKVHIDKAMKAHGEGKFDIALTELQAAYKLDPQVDLLFAIGQVYVKLGRCEEAQQSYDRFLAGTKDAQAKPVVQQAMAACKPAPADEPPPPAVDPKPVTQDPVVAPAPHDPAPKQTAAPTPISSPFAGDGRGQTPEGRSPWYKDPIGDALVVGGVAALVVGGVIYGGARADLDDAERASSLAEYDDLVDQARSKRTTSVILIGGGVALVSAGVVRYMIRDSKKSSRGLGMIPAPGGGFVTMTGRF